MDRRNFLQTVGIALFTSSALGKTQNIPNPNMIQWKDIKKEPPTDENRTYLVFKESCYGICSLYHVCNHNFPVKRALWNNRFKMFWGGEVRKICPITHWAYFNIPETSPDYQEFIKNNPDPV